MSLSQILTVFGAGNSIYNGDYTLIGSNWYGKNNQISSQSIGTGIFCSSTNCIMTSNLNYMDGTYTSYDYNINSPNPIGSWAIATGTLPAPNVRLKNPPTTISAIGSEYTIIAKQGDTVILPARNVHPTYIYASNINFAIIDNNIIIDSSTNSSGFNSWDARWLESNPKSGGLIRLKIPSNAVAKQYSVYAFDNVSYLININVLNKLPTNIKKTYIEQSRYSIDCVFSEQLPYYINTTSARTYLYLNNYIVDNYNYSAKRKGSVGVDRSILQYNFKYRLENNTYVNAQFV